MSYGFGRFSPIAIRSGKTRGVVQNSSREGKAPRTGGWMPPGTSATAVPRPRPDRVIEGIRHGTQRPGGRRPGTTRCTLSISPGSEPMLWIRNGQPNWDHASARGTFPFVNWTSERNLRGPGRPLSSEKGCFDGRGHQDRRRSDPGGAGGCKTNVQRDLTIGDGAV